MKEQWGNRPPKKHDREMGKWRDRENKPKAFAPHHPITPSPHQSSEDLIYGRHPVAEALKSTEGLQVNKLWILKGAAGQPIEEILQLAQEKNIVFQWVDRRRLDEMTRIANHQGVAARVSPYQYKTLEEILAAGKASPLLLLDGIEDPHNLGAILRNAAFFGFSAVVVPRWRSAGLSGTVMKASAGALAKVSLVQVTNIAQTIIDLKQKDFWVYGADGGGEPCGGFSFNEPFALVIGAEGEGLHRLVRERCDALVSVPGSGGMESLNASCASAVLLYEIFRRRKTTGGETGR